MTTVPVAPLEPNPGGVVDPDDLVGREDELTKAHLGITHGGTYLRGERRAGKTSILRRLEADLASTATVIRVSAETDDLATFQDRLLRAIREHHDVGPRLSRWEKEVGGEVNLTIAGTGLKLHGRAARKADDGQPTLTVEDLMLSATARGPAVLMIDEITVLCWQLGPEAATELLRGLRARRQEDPRFAVVLAGSIGLHHALPDLSVVNDLASVDVGPLGEPDAEVLARRLLAGIGMTDASTDIVRRLCDVTERHPFYLQAVVDQLRYQPTESVDRIVSRCIAEDTWQTSHLVSRLDDYFGPDAPAVRRLLDIFATSPQPLSADDALNRLALAHPDRRVGRDELLSWLWKLERDHYLVASDDSRDKMPSLLARIWRTLRKLL